MTSTNIHNNPFSLKLERVLQENQQIQIKRSKLLKSESFRHLTKSDKQRSKSNNIPRISLVNRSVISPFSIPESTKNEDPAINLRKTQKNEDAIQIWSLTELANQIKDEKNPIEKNNRQNLTDLNENPNSNTKITIRHKFERYGERPSDLVEFESNKSDEDSVVLDLDKEFSSPEQEAHVLRNSVTEISESVISAGVSEKNTNLTTLKTIGTVKQILPKFSSPISPNKNNVELSENIKSDSEKLDSDEEWHNKPSSHPKYQVKQILNKISQNTSKKTPSSPSPSHLNYREKRQAKLIKAKDAIKVPLKCALNLSTEFTTDSMIFKYKDHCAEMIQKIWRGYKIRDKYRDLLFRRIYYRELRRALLSGWKTRKIMKTDKCIKGKENVRNWERKFGVKNKNEDLRKIRRKLVEEFMSIFNVLYLTGKWTRLNKVREMRMPRKMQGNNKNRAVSNSPLRKNKNIIRTQSPNIRQNQIFTPLYNNPQIPPVYPYIIPMYFPIKRIQEKTSQPEKRKENEIAIIQPISIGNQPTPTQSQNINKQTPIENKPIKNEDEKRARLLSSFNTVKSSENEKNEENQNTEKPIPIPPEINKNAILIKKSREIKPKEVKKFSNFDEIPLPKSKFTDKIAESYTNFDKNSSLRTSPRTANSLKNVQKSDVQSKSPKPFLKRKTKKMEPTKINWKRKPRIDCWWPEQGQEKIQIIAIHKQI